METHLIRSFTLLALLIACLLPELLGAGEEGLDGVQVRSCGANAGGHGYFMTPNPKPLNYLGESGKVEVLAK